MKRVICAAATMVVVATMVASIDAQAGKAQGPTFSTADVDGFQRGFTRELEYLKNPPKTAANRFGGLTPGQEEAAIGEGAKASGLGLNRYKEIHDAILNVLRTLDAQDKIPGPVQVDLSRVSPEQRKQLARDPFLDLPSGSASALKSRLGQLAPMWVTYINLVAVAG